MDKMNFHPKTLQIIGISDTEEKIVFRMRSDTKYCICSECSLVGVDLSG